MYRLIPIGLVLGLLAFFLYDRLKWRKPRKPVLAPEGQTWLCPHCARHGKNRYQMGDTSCGTAAILVYEESLRYEDGVFITAEAVEDPEAELEQ